MKVPLLKDRRLPRCCHKVLVLLSVAVCLGLLLFVHGSFTSVRKVGDWHLKIKENIDTKASPLIKTPDQDTYLFSAIIPFQQSGASPRVATVTLFDASFGTQICCVLDERKNLTVSVAKWIRQFQYNGVFSHFVSYMTGQSVPYPARQLGCISNPDTDTHLSIASESCSGDIGQYKLIVKPRGEEGKLGVCAKIAYNEGLKQERLVEWMEFQKMMGVDRVVVYTLDISEKVHGVFKLYSDFVTTVPFELPGTIIRSMRAGNRSFPQFSHDEQVAVFDCKERLSGFSHVAGIDFDEFLLPRSNQTLKEYLQTTLARRHPTAGAYYFHQQFHITDWRPSNQDEPLTSLQYQYSVPPRWESQKFVYIPERTQFAQTHWVHVKPEFQTIKVDPSDAVIHHYRACPESWKDCHTLTKLLDPDITRYKTTLVARVKVMMEKLTKGDHP